MWISNFSKVLLIGASLLCFCYSAGIAIGGGAVAIGSAGVGADSGKVNNGVGRPGVGGSSSTGGSANSSLAGASSSSDSGTGPFLKPIPDLGAGLAGVGADSGNGNNGVGRPGVGGSSSTGGSTNSSLAGASSSSDSGTGPVRLPIPHCLTHAVDMLTCELCYIGYELSSDYYRCNMAPIINFRSWRILP